MAAQVTAPPLGVCAGHLSEPVPSGETISTGRAPERQSRKSARLRTRQLCLPQGQLLRRQLGAPPATQVQPRPSSRQFTCSCVDLSLPCTWCSASRSDGSSHLHPSGRRAASARFAARTLSPREAGGRPYPRAQAREQPSGLRPRCQGCVPVPTAAYPSSSGTWRVCSACPQCQAKSQER